MNKRLRQIISLISLLVMLIAADRLLGYALEPMSRSDYFLHDMEEIRRSGENIDMLIVGNSRSVYGFDPLIFEEELGVHNVYNASVVGQQISSKYYIAESVIRAFDPRIVVFDVEWQSLNDFGTDRTQAKLLGLDRLTGLTKLRYIFDAFDISEMIYAFSKPYRFRDNLFKKGNIANNLRLKKWLHNTNYSENYFGTVKGYDKGSACSGKPFPIYHLGTFDPANFSEASKGYLDRIVALCRSRNINLFLVSPPISTMQQMNIGNYQEANDYYKTYAKENGVVYHNMNLLKNKDVIFNDGVFFDRGHLCEPGAAAASRLYAQIIRDELEGRDTNDLFYGSMDEFSADISRVVAVGADISTEGKNVEINDLSYSGGKNIIPDFEIQISDNGKAYETIGKVSPPDDHYEFTWNHKSRKFKIKITGKDKAGETEAYAEYAVDLDKNE